MTILQRIDLLCCSMVRVFIMRLFFAVALRHINSSLGFIIIKLITSNSGGKCLLNNFIEFTIKKKILNSINLFTKIIYFNFKKKPHRSWSVRSNQIKIFIQSVESWNPYIALILIEIHRTFIVRALMVWVVAPMQYIYYIPRYSRQINTQVRKNLQSNCTIVSNEHTGFECRYTHTKNCATTSPNRQKTPPMLYTHILTTQRTIYTQTSILTIKTTLCSPNGNTTPTRT